MASGNSESCASGCLGVFLALGAIVIGGFWPLIAFESLPWFFKYSAWVLWVTFSITSIWLLSRRKRAKREMGEFDPYVEPEGDSPIAVLKREFLAGKITAEEYQYRVSNLRRRYRKRL